jgi:hypothetical protein
MKIGMWRSNMRSRSAAAVLGLLCLVLFSSCAQRSGAAQKSRIVGTWAFEQNGMDWKWNFGGDGSLTWAIIGQTGYDSTPLVIGGDGSYSFDGAALSLRLNKFAGIPGGIWRSEAAAPGFDPVTAVAVRFRGADEMTWSFSTEALGKEDLTARRTK